MKKLLLILCLIQFAYPQKWIMPYVGAWDLNMTGITGGANAANYGNTLYRQINYGDTIAVHRIMFNAGQPDSNGVYDSTETWDGTYQRTSDLLYYRMKPFNDTVHQAGQAISICFFLGNDESMKAVRNRPSTLIANMMRFVQRHQYDGVDIDWEPPVAADTAYMRIFFSLLADSVHSYNQYAFPTRPMIISAYWFSLYGFWASVQNYIDRMNFGNYDWANGNYWGFIPSNSPAYSTEIQVGTSSYLPSSARLARIVDSLSIPRSKVGLGMALGGGWMWRGGTYPDGQGVNSLNKLWTGSPSATNAPTRANTTEWAYEYLKRTFLDNTPANIQYDTPTKTPFYVSDNSGSATDTLIAYEDTTTVQWHIKVAKDSSFGGLMLWYETGQHLSATYFPSATDRNPFMTAVYRNFVNYDLDADSIFAVVSGSGQTNYVSTQLSTPFTVSVLSELGVAISGVSVTFSIYSYPASATGQSLTTTSTTTNGSGLATTTLTLGDKAGTYVVRATANLTESPLSFTSTATVVPAPNRRSPFRE